MYGNIFCVSWISGGCCARFKSFCSAWMGKNNAGLFKPTMLSDITAEARNTDIIFIQRSFKRRMTLKKLIIFACTLMSASYIYADFNTGGSWATQNPNTVTSTITAAGFVATAGGIGFPDGTIQNTAAASVANTLNTSISTQTKTGGLILNGSIQASSASFTGGPSLATSSSTYLASGGGLVGIGTINPTAKLNISGGDRTGSLKLSDNGSVAAGIDFDNSGLSNGIVYTMGQTKTGDSPGAGVFYVRDENQLKYRVILDTTGNVGIGTTQAVAKVGIYANAVVSSSGSDVLRLSANFSTGTTGSGPILNFCTMDNQVIGRISFQNDSVQASTAAAMAVQVISSGTLSEQMRISNIGNMGIGTNAPASKLDVFGGSITVRGTNAGISASTYTVDGTQLFVSSGIINGFGGYSICASSSSVLIGANSTLTVGIAGISTFQTPMISEVRGVALSLTDSVGINSASYGTNTFTVFNADATNAKRFNWWAFCKP